MANTHTRTYVCCYIWGCVCGLGIGRSATPVSFAGAIDCYHDNTHGHGTPGRLHD
jgi:hypothetical protein